MSVTDGAASLPAALAASKVESAPLREDQVANAVAFLTNPKVVVRLRSLDLCLLHWTLRTRQCCMAVALLLTGKCSLSRVNVHQPCGPHPGLYRGCQAILFGWQGRHRRRNRRGRPPRSLHSPTAFSTAGDPKRATAAERSRRLCRWSRGRSACIVGAALGVHCAHCAGGVRCGHSGLTARAQGLVLLLAVERARGRQAAARGALRAVHKAARCKARRGHHLRHRRLATS